MNGFQEGVRELVAVAPIQLHQLAAAMRIERASFTEDVWDAEGYLDLLEEAGGALVATVSGLVVGVVWWEPDQNETSMYATSLAVLPEYRKCGVARRLAEALIDLAGQEGFDSVTLDVRETNVHVVSFYERLGFREYSRTLDFYEDGVTAIHMALFIAL